jgi:hypothetical protein
MISIGKNIRQMNDPLEKITLKQLAGKIRNPHQKFIDFINQLRKIQTIDAKKYRELKTRLPYVVAATFNPPFRKNENFASAEYFILDLDHLADKELDIDYLTAKLKADNRIALMFRSPSDDGLKLFFEFSKPEYDAGRYTFFYKFFANAFAREYSIDQIVDKKTSDVSRACFVSYDPDVWFNESNEKVSVDSYIDFNNEPELLSLEHSFKKAEKEQKELLGSIVTNTDVTPQDIDSDIIREIREKLNPGLKEKREKRIFVPDELESIIDITKKKLNEYGFEIDEIINIHYGKQFRLKLKHLKAEVNVFYGKKGFRVVKSTKSGTNSELTELAHPLISEAWFSI